MFLNILQDMSARFPISVSWSVFSLHEKEFEDVTDLNDIEI